MSELELPIAEGTIEAALDPRAHNSLFGHDEARAQMIAAFDQHRFPQAWLITGQDGIGKATLAWQIARELAETATLSGSYQPSNETLARYRQHNHPNVIAITRPPAERGGFKTQIPIETIRDLNQSLHLASAEQAWRAVIIDPIDALNNAGANALLKLLEEPPARLVFFLISHAPASLLPTIRSRCQMLRLDPLKAEEMAKIWAAVSDERVPSLSDLELAEGSMSAAFRNQSGFGDDYRQALALLSQDQMDDANALALTQSMIKSYGTAALDMAGQCFTLLPARILRAATGTANMEEAALAARFETLASLHALAEFSSESAEQISEAKALNLDAESVIYHRWRKFSDCIKRARL